MREMLSSFPLSRRRNGLSERLRDLLRAPRPTRKQLRGDWKLEEPDSKTMFSALQLGCHDSSQMQTSHDASRPVAQTPGPSQTTQK